MCVCLGVTRTRIGERPSKLGRQPRQWILSNDEHQVAGGGVQVMQTFCW